MVGYIHIRKAGVGFKCVSMVLVVSLIVTSFTTYLLENKQNVYASIVDNPLTGLLPVVSPKVSTQTNNLPLMKGVSFKENNPFDLEFYFDTMNKANLKPDEIDRLTKYFLGFLAVSREKLWVNLSPYEKDRIVPQALEKIDIGKDLLLEDYLLKQLTSSLTDPKTSQGKKFWQEVYRAAERIAGTTKVPINNFYKVWIVPDIAEIYEYSVGAGSKPALNKQNKIVAFVKEAKLKVMMETDYHNNVKQQGKGLISPVPDRHNLKIQEINNQAKEIFRKELLPIIEEQVNNSVTFAPLRQMYYAFILASYFKEKLKNHVFYSRYFNQEKSKPINLDNLKAKEIIYQSYLNSLEQGIYQTIKSESDAKLDQKVNRKYFSGGMGFNIAPKVTPGFKLNSFLGTNVVGKLMRVTSGVSAMVGGKNVVLSQFVAGQRVLPFNGEKQEFLSLGVIAIIGGAAGLISLYLWLRQRSLSNYNYRKKYSPKALDKKSGMLDSDEFFMGNLQKELKQGKSTKDILTGYSRPDFKKEFKQEKNISPRKGKKFNSFRFASGGSAGKIVTELSKKLITGDTYAQDEALDALVSQDNANLKKYALPGLFHALTGPVAIATRAMAILITIYSQLDSNEDLLRDLAARGSVLERRGFVAQCLSKIDEGELSLLVDNSEQGGVGVEVAEGLTELKEKFSSAQQAIQGVDDIFSQAKRLRAWLVYNLLDDDFQDDVVEKIGVEQVVTGFAADKYGIVKMFEKKQMAEEFNPLVDAKIIVKQPSGEHVFAQGYRELTDEAFQAEVFKVLREHFIKDGWDIDSAQNQNRVQEYAQNVVFIRHCALTLPNIQDFQEKITGLINECAKSLKADQDLALLSGLSRLYEELKYLPLDNLNTIIIVIEAQAGSSYFIPWQIKAFAYLRFQRGQELISDAFYQAFVLTVNQDVNNGLSVIYQQVYKNYKQYGLFVNPLNAAQSIILFLETQLRSFDEENIVFDLKVKKQAKENSQAWLDNLALEKVKGKYTWLIANAAYIRSSDFRKAQMKTVYLVYCMLDVEFKKCIDRLGYAQVVNAFGGETVYGLKDQFSNGNGGVTIFNCLLDNSVILYDQAKKTYSFNSTSLRNKQEVVRAAEAALNQHSNLSKKDKEVALSDVALIYDTPQLELFTAALVEKKYKEMIDIYRDLSTDLVMARTLRRQENQESDLEGIKTARENMVLNLSRVYMFFHYFPIRVIDKLLKNIEINASNTGSTKGSLTFSVTIKSFAYMKAKLGDSVDVMPYFQCFSQRRKGSGELETLLGNIYKTAIAKNSLNEAYAILHFLTTRLKEELHVVLSPEITPVQQAVAYLKAVRDKSLPEDENDLVFVYFIKNKNETELISTKDLWFRVINTLSKKNDLNSAIDLIVNALRSANYGKFLLAQENLDLAFLAKTLGKEAFVDKLLEVIKFRLSGEINQQTAEQLKLILEKIQPALGKFQNEEKALSNHVTQMIESIESKFRSGFNFGSLTIVAVGVFSVVFLSAYLYYRFWLGRNSQEGIEPHTEEEIIYVRGRGGRNQVDEGTELTQVDPPIEDDADELYLDEDTVLTFEELNNLREDWLLEEMDDLGDIIRTGEPLDEDPFEALLDDEEHLTLEQQEDLDEDIWGDGPLLVDEDPFEDEVDTEDNLAGHRVDQSRLNYIAALPANQQRKEIVKELTNLCRL